MYSTKTCKGWQKTNTAKVKNFQSETILKLSSYIPTLLNNSFLIKVAGCGKVVVYKSEKDSSAGDLVILEIPFLAISKLK